MTPAVEGIVVHMHLRQDRSGAGKHGKAEEIFAVGGHVADWLAAAVHPLIAIIVSPLTLWQIDIALELTVTRHHGHQQIPADELFMADRAHRGVVLIVEH